MATPTSECTYLPYILKSGWVTRNGDHVSVAWKAYSYVETGRASWEVRLILQDFYKGSTVNFSVANFVKESKQSLNEIWSTFDISWDSVFIPSLHMYVAKRGAGPIDPMVRQEAQLFTKGVLMWLLSWGHGRRRRDDCVQAKAMLAALLSNYIDLYDVRKAVVARIIDLNVVFCNSGPVRPGGWCHHLDEDLVDFMNPRAAYTWDFFIDGLVKLFGCCDCRAATCSLEAVVQSLAVAIDAAIEAECEGVEATPQGLLELASGCRKRRRVDEDFKRHITETMFRNRQARSTGSVLRHFLPVDASTGRQWEKAYVLQHFFANKNLMTCKSVTCVAEDGSKQGRPCEETLLFFVWDAEKDLATIAAPQAGPSWRTIHNY
jgi:hypothetical protein